jgi:hypothetical protein
MWIRLEGAGSTARAEASMSSRLQRESEAMRARGPRGNCSDGREVQWHTLSRWFANVEIYICLLVAFGVLLSPQNQQKRRKLGEDNLRPVDLRVTSRTESDHQMQNRVARFPMMHSGIGITAHPTGVSIAL